MITYYREMARDTLIESGILQKEGDTWKIITADKYPVVIELAKLTDITTSHARTLINRIIANVKAESPAQVMIDANLRDQVQEVLSTLTPREEKVIRMRYGIGEKSNYSLEEIGSMFNLTRERIRQIEIKALRKLRHAKRRKSLETFLEV